jgi:hypothetical protein
MSRNCLCHIATALERITHGYVSIAAHETPRKCVISASGHERALQSGSEAHGANAVSTSNDIGQSVVSAGIASLVTVACEAKD